MLLGVFKLNIDKIAKIIVLLKKMNFAIENLHLCFVLEKLHSFLYSLIQIDKSKLK